MGELEPFLFKKVKSSNSMIQHIEMKNCNTIEGVGSRELFLGELKTINKLSCVEANNFLGMKKPKKFRSYLSFLFLLTQQVFSFLRDVQKKKEANRKQPFCVILAQFTFKKSGTKPCKLFFSEVGLCFCPS